MLPSWQPVFALVACASTAAHASDTLRQLYQFPNYLQWVENMAVRSNGNILITTFDQAHIYELDPHTDQPPHLVATLPDADAALGIAEVAPDIFAVAGGYLNRTDYHLHGTGRIHLVDFTCTTTTTTTTEPLLLDLDQDQQPARVPRVSTAVQYPEAKLPNGMAALPSHPHILLSADSITGTIYRLNTATGHVDVALQDALLAPNTTNPDPFLRLLGVNGLKLHQGYLYVTSSSRQFLARYPVDELGTPLAALELLVRYPTPRSPDDISVARDGTIYGAVPLNSVSKLSPGSSSSSSNVTYIVDHLDDLQHTTSVILSRDETILYVSTGGRNDPNGRGGQIFAVGVK